MKTAIMVLLVCWISSAFALPAENKQPPAKEQKQQSKPEQAKPETAPTPPIVQIRNEVTGYRGEQAPTKEEKHPDEVLAWRATAASAGIALLALVVAGVQAWFFKTQLGHMVTALNDSKTMAEAAKESAEVAKQSLYKLQRAQVFMQRFLDSGVLNEKGEIVQYWVWVEWKNSGNTLGAKGRSRISIQTAAKDAPIPVFTSADNASAKYIFTPGGAANSARIPIATRNLVAAYRGEMKIYIWARCDYEDIFENPHHHEVCAEVNVVRDPNKAFPGDASSLAFNAVGEQNTAS